MAMRFREPRRILAWALTSTINEILPFFRIMKDLYPFTWYISVNLCSGSQLDIYSRNPDNVRWSEDTPSLLIQMNWID